MIARSGRSTDIGSGSGFMGRAWNTSIRGHEMKNSLKAEAGADLRPRQPSERREMYDALMRLQRDSYELRQRICRSDDLIDSIVQDMSKLIGEVNRILGLSSSVIGRGAPATRRRRPEDPPPLPNGVSVDSLQIEVRAGGSSRVRIVGNRAFTLSRKPAMLLRILAADGAPADTVEVGWKLKRDVVIEMEKRLGGGFNRRAINTQVWRLRDAFRKHGIHPWLLQANRKQGLRFAVRRGGLTVTEIGLS